MTDLCYVYAVTLPFGTALPQDVRGVGGARPQLLIHDGLTAVVSAVPAEDFHGEALRAHLEDLDWLTATARGHEAVIGALAQVTTPLPLRLATVCHDHDGVRRLLDSGREQFVRSLDRLDGRVEWGVKVYADDGAAEAPRDDRASGDAPANGRDYLRQRLRRREAGQSRWSEAVTLSHTLHAKLTRLAEAGLVHHPQDARLPGVPRGNVLNAAYLVPRERSEAFVAEVGRLAPAGRGVRLELTGPWAPYSFAREVDEV
ncbi:GvpL/GvpF family gas vesicle protein [Streptomyces sp. NBC_00390]|uniref:GvpL/GvpF family gas vesicle protein n=1 Tax=Streptomyces sp. NBC_00390 TaxID=2975736 RepID=UPI002E231B34